MKMKKLLASALAAAMVVSSMIGTMVTSAATTAGAISVESVEITEGTTTFDADITVTFGAEIKSPHAIFDIAAEGYILESVTSADTNLTVEADGVNYAEGKVLVETAVDSKAPTYAAGSTIVLTATFVEDDTANVAGEYAITVSAADVTAYGEDDLALTAGAGAVTVAAEVKEPVEDLALKFASASVGYGTSSLEMTFRVMKTVVSKYDSFEVIITPNKYNTTTFNLETPASFTAPLTDKGNFYEYKYTDIQLYELGLEIEYMIKAYNDGEYVAYATYSTTPAAYLITTYGKSSDAKLRTLIADTLVVGDTAAKTFGKAGSALAAAESIIKDFDISEATQSYGTPNSVNNHTATNPAYNTVSGSARRVNLGVAIGKVPYINYRIQNCKDLDINKLSINVAYTQTTGVGATKAYNYTFTSADAALTKNENNGLITLKFDQVGLADASKDITFTVTYDGAELCNTVYSIETFLGGKTNDASIGNIAVALLKLSASATAKLA